MKHKKVVCFVKKNKLWIIMFLCMIGFLLLAEDVFRQEIMNGDIIGYKILSKYFISDTVTPIAKLITNFGGAYFLFGFTVIMIITLREKNQKMLVAVNLVIVTVLNQILKQIVKRPRPIEYSIINETGYSFPSGHSMVSMAFYGYLIYLTYKNISQPYLKWIIICVLGVLILAIGISRIYLGVHYTSDVLAGFLISIMYLIVFIKAANGVLRKKERQ